jgi:hypothetical protein
MNTNIGIFIVSLLEQTKYFGIKMIYIAEYTHGTLLKATSARSDVSGTAYCK